MHQAHRESSVPPCDIDETSVELTRQLYIHGITYLLRGLPNALTPEESLSLQAAVPPGLLKLEAEADIHSLMPDPRNPLVAPKSPPRHPTILHRMTAALVFQMFVLIQFLLPYLTLLVSRTYQFERKHQITKRLVNSSVTTVDELSRRSLRLSQTICQMNDGKVGQAINEMMIWWIAGVTGGVQQGIEEGLSAVGSKATIARTRVIVEKTT